MLEKQLDTAFIAEETPSQILDVLLKAADSVLARSRARTLRAYGADMEPRYEPARDPTDMRLCA
ncbi:MAG: hypothetical protein WC617_12590 [Rhodanobacter sp.]|jgi:hypothetical protein